MNDLTKKLAYQLRAAANYIDTLGGVSKSYRQTLAEFDATPAQAVPEAVTVEMLKAGASEWLKHGEQHAIYPLAQGFDSPGLCPLQRIEYSRATHVYRAMRAVALAATPATQGASMTTEQLPPLPEPEELGMDFDKGWDGVRAYGYTADQMHAYAKAAQVAQVAQAEADRKDAERYRWLRDTNQTRPDMTDGSRVILWPNEVISIWHGLPEEQWDLMGGCLQCSIGDEFDAAIDAAMKEQA